MQLASEIRQIQIRIAWICIAVIVTSCSDQSVDANAQINSAADINSQKEKLGVLLADAEAGDATSSRLLGEAYSAGVDVDRDRIEGHRWLVRAAELGDASAQIAVARNLLDGVVVRENVPEAIEWLQQANPTDSPEARHLLARAYLWKSRLDVLSLGLVSPNDGSVSQKLLAEFSTVLRSGQDENLEKSLLDGTTNFSQILELLADAVETRDAMAIGQLGTIYWNGLGVEVDKVKGLALWKQAAELGDPWAQKVLGVRLLNGEGVPQDPETGIGYLERAANSGWIPAQKALAAAFDKGNGVPVNHVMAARWTMAAAIQGDPLAQGSVGLLFKQGKGVEQDAVLAHAWINLSGVRGNRSLANILLADIALSDDEKTEAERLASAWKLDQPIQRENGEKQRRKSEEMRKISSGTAVVVNTSGDAITNSHVIDGCNRVLLRGNTADIKIIASDPKNDIAALRLPEYQGEAATLAAKSREPVLGENIVVYGFPMQGILSNNGNITAGLVSAMTGVANNSSQIQITAPIQPGSSGSPVINTKGEIVGLVVQKLSDQAVAESMNVIPQSVNFAINISTINRFLEANQISYESGGWLASTMDQEAVAAEAGQWVYAIECWRGADPN